MQLKNQLLILLILCGLACIIAGPAFGSENLSRNQVLRKAFPLADTFFRKVVRLTSGQVERLSRASGQKITSRFITVYIAKKGDGKLGYGFIDRTRGKSSFIKYFVAITTSGEIHSIEIMSYRGKKGSAVCMPRFKDQFTGKNRQSLFKIGVDVDAMSGATISSRAVTNGVRKIMHIWQEFFGSHDE